MLLLGFRHASSCLAHEFVRHWRLLAVGSARFDCCCDWSFFESPAALSNETGAQGEPVYLRLLLKTAVNPHELKLIFRACP